MRRRGLGHLFDIEARRPAATRMSAFTPLGPDAPLRAVAIGAGRRGAAHARAARQCGVEIAAVFDPDADRAATLAAESGSRSVSSLEDALHAGAQVALVTSPPPVHREQCLAALRAGCHLVLEKPIALTMDEAREVGGAAEAAGRLVHVCQQQRYSEAADHARAALAGRKVALVHIWLYRQAPDIRANWDRAWGGGHVVEWAIHPLDFCRYVVGEIDSVFACYTDQVLAGTEGWSNWDAYSASFRFAGGAVGSLATTYAVWPGAGDGFGVDIIAEGCLVRWRKDGLSVETPSGARQFPEAEEPTVRLHRAFYHALRSGDLSGIRLSYPDALGSLAAVLACNRSHATGSPVRPADL